MLPDGMLLGLNALFLAPAALLAAAVMVLLVQLMAGLLRPR